MTVTATLDKQAAVFASDVQVSDLAASGWRVAGPTPGANGSVVFTATKSFANPTAAQAVIAQLSGTNGPFRGLAIVSRRSFFQTKTSFSGTVDLTCGLSCFADPQLQQTLGGSPTLGLDPSALQADGGVDVDHVVQFHLAARLAGTMKSNAPGATGGVAQWQIALGQKAALVASSQAWDIDHIVLCAVAGLLLLVVGVLSLARQGRRRSPPARHRARS